MTSPQPRIASPLPSLRRATPVALLLAALLTACASDGPAPEEPPAAEREGAVLDGVILEPWEVTSSAEADDAATGMLLTQLDDWITSWNKLSLTASSDREMHKFRVLDQKIASEVEQNFTKLEEQLRLGPPINRTVAAMAMGFARADRALSPLLGALEDPEPSVVANACMGLGLLRDRATPVTGLADLLDADEASVRSSASWALSRLAKEGADVEGAREPARRGLLDSDPAVRVHCAVVLASLLDREAIGDLTLLLSDGENLVVKGAARSIAYIGRNDPHAKGTAARALAGALPRMRGDSKDIVLGELQLLSERNFGEDEEAWAEWANRLPL